MPSPSPDKSIKYFHDAVLEHWSLSYDLLTMINDSSGGENNSRLQLRRAAATDFFFRIATEWQIFQDDWTVRAIAHKPATFLKRQRDDLDRRLQESRIQDRVALFSDSEIAVPTFPATITAPKVRKVLDANGLNIEFSSSAEWSKFATKNLDGAHRQRLVRQLSNPENSSFLDLVRVMRNAIAHRSTTSMTDVQRYIAPRAEGSKVGLTGSLNHELAALRENKLKDLGTYLDKKICPPADHNAATPAFYMAERLLEFADGLKWGN